MLRSITHIDREKKEWDYTGEADFPFPTHQSRHTVTLSARYCFSTREALGLHLVVYAGEEPRKFTSSTTIMKWVKRVPGGHEDNRRLAGLRREIVCGILISADVDSRAELERINCDPPP